VLLASRNRHAAVRHDHLTRDEACGRPGEECRNAADLVRRTDAAQRGLRIPPLQILLVLP
jgi:hypothetical protein